ncbi:MAG: hypothetical protein GXP31_14410 [Kiritimatiellaeota bacterium]|nr:hypothetical protein [Kiritimatiellota bacterium]
MKWPAERHRCRKRYFATTLVLLATGLVLAFNGCLPKSPRSAVPFNHKEHLENADDDQKALFTNCGRCHNTNESGADVLPTHKICLECHDFDMDKPDEMCLTCHPLPKAHESAPRGKLLVRALKDLYAEREKVHKERMGDEVWDHSRLEGKVKCKVCHGDVLRGEYRDPLQFHRNQKVTEKCTACHETNRKEIPPRSHASVQAWKRQHGAQALSRQLPGCETCHQKSFCDDCHKTEKPRNHTAMFRNRGHGFMAAGNRRQCATCHQTDFCESCHRNVEPPNHTAIFKSRTHCLSCHEQSTRRGTRCQVCHTLDLNQHTTVGRPPPGTHLHVVPQGFGSSTLSDCKACHDFTKW